MNQRDVVENGNSQLTQIFPGGVLEEITVLRAQYVCLTDDGRLHNDNVVHITDGRSNERIQFDKFRGLVEEIDVVENKVLGQVVERL
jgi:hypothetical protein